MKSSGETGEGDGVLTAAHSSVLSIINKTPLEQFMQQFLEAENHSFLSKKASAFTW